MKKKKVTKDPVVQKEFFLFAPFKFWGDEKYTGKLSLALFRVKVRLHSTIPSIMFDE
jgi:hypothetical protein